MNFADYAWFIPVFPFLSFFVILLLMPIRKRLGNKASIIAVAGVVSSFVFSALLMWELLSGAHTGSEQSIIWISNPEIEFGITVDHLSALMALMVSFLSMLIVIYSSGYMSVKGHRSPEHTRLAPHTEEQLPRYYAEISLFICAMLGLVLSNNFLQMYIFWEIVGLCSYLLIGYWYVKPEAAAAAKKAFLVTRLGDIFFMFGIAILFVNFGTFNIEKLAASIPNGWPLITISSLLIFGGAMGKSAQFPLHVWLPDAMEGPTTVSALIHAATMVKAGVFLVARSFPIFSLSPDALLFVAIIGAVTAFIAATMALVQTDIKKVLAYSTISQLGYMMLALGTGLYVIGGFSAGMLHLLNHAIFKALLFLCAGSVIHAVATNEMTKMGGLHRKMKITSAAMLFGSLSIAGFPFFSGFFSKDLILEVTYEAGHQNYIFYALFLLAVATAFLTAFYMFRMWFMTFTGKPRSREAEHAHESPAVMWVPLAILAVLALSSGYVLFFGWQDFMQPAIPSGIAHTVHALTADASAHHATAPTIVGMFTNWLTWLSIVIGLAGISLAYAMYCGKTVETVKSDAGTVRRILLKKYWMDDLYMSVSLKAGYGFAKACDWYDRLVVDGVVNGLSGLTVKASRIGRKLQTGNVQDYATVIAGGICAVVFLVYSLKFVGVI